MYIYIDIMRGRNTSSIICTMFIRNGPRCPKNLISLEKPLCKRPRSLTLPSFLDPAMLVKSLREASKPNEFLIVKASRVLDFVSRVKRHVRLSKDIFFFFFFFHNCSHICSRFVETFLANVCVCVHKWLYRYIHMQIRRWSVVYCMEDGKEDSKT